MSENGKAVQSLNELEIIFLFLSNKPEITRQIVPLVHPDMFENQLLRDIYLACLDSFTKNSSVSFAYIKNKLGEEKYKELSRAFKYFDDIKEDLIGNYREILLSFTEQRIKDLGCRAMMELISQSNEIPVLDFISSIEDLTRELSYIADIKEGIHEPKNLAEELVIENQKFPTPYFELNKLTDGGISLGDYIIFAGTPGTGKTSLLLNLVLYWIKLEIPMLFVTLETMPAGLIHRLLCCKFGHSLGFVIENLREKNIDYLKFIEETNENLKIMNATGVRTNRLVNQVVNANKTHRFKIILIDYIQLISAGKSEQIESEVRSASRGLVEIRNKTNCTIIAVSQLNRGERIDLQRLRGSGALEQDADIVAFLIPPSRDRVEGLVQNDREDFSLQVRILKHRNGPLGKFNLNFKKQHFQITDKLEDFLDI